MVEHSGSGSAGSGLRWEPAAEPHVGGKTLLAGGDCEDLHTNEEKFVSAMDFYTRLGFRLTCLFPHWCTNIWSRARPVHRSASE